jgi:starch-binding outer membrane protein, SusD/RagB family
MKNRYWMVPLALACTLGACDNMLEEEPRSFITTETYYRTVDDLERGMLAGWGSLRTVFNGTTGGWWGSLGNMSDQERIHNSAVNQTYSIARLDWTASNPQGLEIGWQNLYRLIFRENIIINRAEAVTTGNAALKAQIVAEAKFMRAYGYMWLDRMYSAGPKTTDLSVALVLTEADQRAAQDASRATVQQVQDAVIKDLTEAEAALPTRTQRGTAGRGQATKGAAQMALADLYLWRSSYMQTGEWNKVVEWTNRVIQSGEYGLVQTGFFNVFNPGAKAANNEQIYFMVAAGAPGRQNSAFTNAHGPRLLGFDTGGGFGSNMVTPWQLSIYASGDIRGRLGPVPVVGTRQTDTVAYRNYGCSLGTVRGFTDQGGRCGPVDPYPYKFRATDLIAANGDVDIPYYRYAETLLMQAEAQNELGNATEAARLINLIRARARRGATGTENRAQPADLAGGLSKPQMRDSVYIERARELAHENKRWIDMVRRDSQDPGYWVAALRNDSQNLELYPNVEQQAFKKRQPIPQREIDLNPNLVQNPGY